MPVLRIAIALLLTVLLAACVSAPPGGGQPADLAALNAVVETFRTSILRKDKPAFVALFFSDQPELVTWQAVLDDPSLHWLQRSRPSAVKARHRPDNNFVAFIDGIVASKVREEETFENVVIDTDGEIASVSFDYRFLSDGRVTNHGREKWLLVRTERGWKITSVVFTLRLAEATRAPN